MPWPSKMARAFSTVEGDDIFFYGLDRYSGPFSTLYSLRTPISWSHLTTYGTIMMAAQASSLRLKSLFVGTLYSSYKSGPPTPVALFEVGDS